jgi:hypothetical protein
MAAAPCGSSSEQFLKRHRDRDRYLAEVTAYRQWVPPLGDRAPRLRACDDSLQIIIMSAMPGSPAPWPAAAMAAEPSAHQAAEAVVQQNPGSATWLACTSASGKPGLT